MTTCPICDADTPMEEIWPFCSVDCLHTNPASKAVQNATTIRRVGTFTERTLGAWVAGGMTPTYAEERLAWYLAGAQDEAAFTKEGDPMEHTTHVIDGVRYIRARAVQQEVARLRQLLARVHPKDTCPLTIREMGDAIARLEKAAAE